MDVKPAGRMDKVDRFDLKVDDFDVNLVHFNVNTVHFVHPPLGFDLEPGGKESKPIESGEVSRRMRC